MTRAIRQMEGKRLMYRESVDCPPYQPALIQQAIDVPPIVPQQASAPFDDDEPIF